MSHLLALESKSVISMTSVLTTILKKSQCNLLVALALFLSIGQSFAITDPFAGGDGSEADPYQIQDWNQLQNLKDYLVQGHYFVLNNDLTPSSTGYAEQVKDGSTLANGGTGWQPLSYRPTEGDPDAPNFSLDGNGYTISGLEINVTSDALGWGLFGVLGTEPPNALANKSAAFTIKNLSLADLSITTSGSAKRIGGLVGETWVSATFENVAVEGSFTSTCCSVGGLVGFVHTLRHNRTLTLKNTSTNVAITNNSPFPYVGGLIGRLVANENGSGELIEDSYSLGDVTSDGRNVGGLFGGSSFDGGLVIRRSYATGDITSTDAGDAGRWVGGLAGRSGATFVDSYATGDVEGANFVGGLIGEPTSDDDSSTPATLTNTYATGVVTANRAGWAAGGFVGKSGATITKSFWNTTVNPELQGTGGESGSLPTDPAELVGKTTAEMKTQSTFMDWSFDVVWDIGPSVYVSFPYLQSITYDEPEATPVSNPIPGLEILELAITTQPSTTALNGVAFTTQPVIQLQDASGNDVSRSGIEITVEIETGGGTLGGTATVTTDEDGTAAFTGLSITGVIGDRTLSFSATGLTAETSDTIEITAGAASQLVITTQPSVTADRGTAFADQPVIQLQDASGNDVSQSGIAVAVEIESGGGTLGGTRTATTESDGAASFVDLEITGMQGERTLRFTADGLTSVISEAVDIKAVAPSEPLDIEVEPLVGGLLVSWTTPLDDGGSPIVRYVARANPSCEVQALPDEVPGVSSYSCEIRELDANLSYTVFVTAITEAGLDSEAAAGAGEGVDDEPATFSPLPPIPVPVNNPVLLLLLAMLILGLASPTVRRFNP